MFVQRQDGAIVGVFANRQPDFATEELSADDPEVVAFKRRDVAVGSPLVALEKRIAALEGKGVGR
jgi:hypothetical protein